MDIDVSADIYVAPLHIKKPSGDGPASRDDFDNRLVTVVPEITTTDTSESHDQSHPVFQNYLRAIYPFSPSAALSPSTVTLTLHAGDLVLVHSVHTNGWADGTLLETGARGWLPTNYCQAYEQTAMRPLLKGLTEFWDLIRAGSSSTLGVFRNQDYMRGLIAGVRYLLERSDCLTRDSLLVKSNEAVRKTRKALLSDLSILVKAAKRLQGLVGNSNDGDVLEETLDEMLLKAFRIVTRGVRFLEIWTDCVVLSQAWRGRNATTEDGFVPPNGSPDSVSIDSFPTSTALHSKKHTKARSNRTSFSFIRSRPSGHMAHDQGPSSSGQITAAKNSRPASQHFKRQSVTHRMSYAGESTGHKDLNLASERLSRCYDTFLGVLASFLGSHLQSRSSSELLLTTQYAVKSCRELLGVVELVLDKRGSPSDMLLEAKDAMYDRITELVHAARDVFRPSYATDDDSVFLPEDGKQLLNAATGCVRVAGDCVAITRLVLEQIGDFEINPSTQCSATISNWEADSPVVPQHEFSTAAPTVELSNQALQHDLMPTSLTRPRIEIPSSTLSTPDLISHSQPSSATATSSVPPTPATVHLGSDAGSPTLPGDSLDGPPDQSVEAIQLKRHKSLARTIVISTGSNSTYVSSVRDSEASATSATSTRATSPDTQSRDALEEESAAGFSESQGTLTDEIEETEAKLMEKTFAHELMFNKDGQLIGGTLDALIERLTAHDCTPDALFVSTFYLTFRLFVSPQKFADALSARFEYVAETPRVAGPVRLRVYNVFKGWLESHWRHDCDDVALPHVVGFARNVMTPVLPAAGKRLLELTEQVSTMSGPLVPRVAASMGRTNTSFSFYVSSESPKPDPVISRSQLLSLRTWKMGGAGVSVVDFDPLELARQITLKVSGLFCSILPEELLATEWTKRSGSLAVNVRAMSTLSTDITNLVADSILQLEEPKKRAATIKQWVKIASKCLELNNFDTLMAIICSLNSTTILRLKRTWDMVSQKTKTLLESLSKVVEFSRNHVVLRQRLQNQKPPCLPFVGMYLTDLTFVDHGNQMTRQLISETGTLSLINFDKHMKTAKIISDLQRFQIPYRLTEVPELQTWMQDQLIRVRSAEEATFQSHYRRSLILEPREQQSSNAPSPIDVGAAHKDKERFDFLAWTHITKEKTLTSQG